MKKILNHSFSRFLCALLAALVLNGCASRAAAGWVTRAEYPAMDPCPEFTECMDENGSLKEGYADGLESFLTGSISAMLDQPGAENRVVSPLNLYMTLALLAESTDGDTRREILTALNCPDLDTLRSRVGALWNAHYRSDDLYDCRIASSLWLDQNAKLDTAALERICRSCFASGYSGTFGSADMNDAYRSWLNEQTSGFLTGGRGTDPAARLMLASTLYFSAGWNVDFRDGSQRIGDFHRADGTTAVCTFLTGTHNELYAQGENFTAVTQRLAEDGQVWFVLPKEGTTPEELASDAQLMELLLRGDQWPGCQYVQVKISLPTFDITAQQDLIPGMQKLGVSAALDPNRADYSVLMPGQKHLVLTEAPHTLRVRVDENGICAEPSDTMTLAVGAMGRFQVDFTLDRPFFFAVTGSDNIPLLTGILNDPAL